MIEILRPWAETAGVLLLGVLGFALGRWSSRLKKPYWTAGYFIPLLLVAIIAAARRIPRLEFLPPFSWLTSGRNEFALIALISTMLLTTPLSRLPDKRQRHLVMIFMAFIVVYYSALPFLLPALIRGRLSRLTTRIDPDGVCLQGTKYNCGPAAAVTALRKLGLPAEEGEIAILAHTSFLSGTQPDSLCLALRRRYAKEGISCEYRYFKSVAELRDAGTVIALIKFGLLVDHYVTVLDVTDDHVIIGDPLIGVRTLSHDEFAEIWRKCGIIVSAATKDEP